MSRLTRLARSLPVLSLICALTVLPTATMQWSAWTSGDDDRPLQAWTARRWVVVGAVCGRGSTDLRELFRASERWHASFLSLASQPTRPNLTLRAASRRARANQHHIAARRSLLRYASGGADDDPPA